MPCPPGCRGHAIMELAMPPSVREATYCTFPKRTYCTQAIIIYTLASPLYHVCVIVCVLLFIRRTYMYYYVCGWSHMLCYIHGDCWFLCSVWRLLDPVGDYSFLCSVWRLLDPVGDYSFLCSVWRLLDPVGDYSFLCSVWRLLDPVGDYSFLCSVWRLLDPVGDYSFLCSVWRLLDPVGDYLFLCSVWRLLDPVGDYSFLCSVWRLLVHLFLVGIIENSACDITTTVKHFQR